MATQKQMGLDGKVKDVSEVLPTSGERLDGEQMDKRRLLDEVLILKDAVILPSSFGEGQWYSVIQADHKGKLITFTGGEVLTKKMKELKNQDLLPIKAKLIMPKGKRYYDFGSAK